MTHRDIVVGQAVNVRIDFNGEKVSHRVETVSKVDRWRIHTRGGAFVYSRKDGRSLNAHAAVAGYQTYIEIYTP